MKTSSKETAKAANLDNRDSYDNDTVVSGSIGKRMLCLLCVVTFLEIVTTFTVHPKELFGQKLNCLSNDARTKEKHSHHHHHHNNTKDAKPFESFATKFHKHNKRCSHENFPPIKTINIHGERHHGTNFVRCIIGQNALPSVKCLMDPEHGWKHGMLLPPRANLKKNELLLIISRDIFSWLPKMHKNTYCHNEDSGEDLSFSDFLRSDYKCNPHPVLNVTDISATNIIRMRTKKYKHWLTHNPDYFNFNPKPKFCTRVHLRYESIIEDGQENTIGEILKGYGINSHTEFYPVAKHAGPRGAVGKQHTKTDIQRESRDVLAQYSIDDLLYVLENLDLEFEKNVLNYTYDYVLDYIEEETEKVRNTLSNTLSS